MRCNLAKSCCWHFEQITSFMRCSYPWMPSHIRHKYYKHNVGHLLCKEQIHPYYEGLGSKMALDRLKMLRFSIRNHRWKAQELYNSKIREIFLSRTSRPREFAKFSCRENFLFYSRFCIRAISGGHLTAEKKTLDVFATLTPGLTSGCLTKKIST